MNSFLGSKKQNRAGKVGALKEKIVRVKKKG